jgi:hypothetical protein
MLKTLFKAILRTHPVIALNQSPIPFLMTCMSSRQISDLMRGFNSLGGLLNAYIKNGGGGEHLLL